MKYYVSKNAQEGGEHEVHVESCAYFPNIDNRLYLGDFFSCKEAIMTARGQYKEVDGCFYCCNACHHR
jgi:hypothetical protein